MCFYARDFRKQGTEETQRKKKEKKAPNTGGKKSWRLSRWEETHGKGGKEGGPGSSMVMAKGGNVCDGGGNNKQAGGEGNENPKNINVEKG